MNHKKILFILHLPPPIHGAAMMGKYIQDSKIINETFECRYINLATAKDLADIGKVGIGKITQFVSLLKAIRKEVKLFKPDLVYITPNAAGGAFYKDFIVVQMLKSLGCKVVAHYHNKGIKERESHFIDNRLYSSFFKDLKVILLSDLLYYDIEKYVKKEFIRICANGIPTIQEEFTTKKKESIVKLLYLSNLIVSKGIWVLLDACKIIKEKGYHFTCDVVGGETQEVNNTIFIEEIKKRELDGCVTYLGKKYGTEKLKCLQESHVFLFPTFYPKECFPVVLLEAMEQKLPCISTYEAAIPSIIDEGKTGLLVKSKDAIDLAEKIIFLLDNPTLAEEMGKAGQQKFQQHYTLAHFEKKLITILKECITS